MPQEPKVKSLQRCLSISSSTRFLPESRAWRGVITKFLDRTEFCLSTFLLDGKNVRKMGFSGDNMFWSGEKRTLKDLTELTPAVPKREVFRCRENGECLIRSSQFVITHYAFLIAFGVTRFPAAAAFINASYNKKLPQYIISCRF